MHTFRYREDESGGVMSGGGFASSGGGSTSSGAVSSEARPSGGTTGEGTTGGDTTSSSNDCLTEAARASLTKHGFVVIENVLNPVEITAAIRHFGGDLLACCDDDVAMDPSLSSARVVSLYQRLHSMSLEEVFLTLIMSSPLFIHPHFISSHPMLLSLIKPSHHMHSSFLTSHVHALITHPLITLSFRIFLSHPSSQHTLSQVPLHWPANTDFNPNQLGLAQVITTNPLLPYLNLPLLNLTITLTMSRT